MKKKITIIGFGKLGLLHFCISNIYKESEVVCIVEKNSLIRFFLKILFFSQIKIYNNIKNDIIKYSDAIIIATPPHSTPEILKELVVNDYKGILLIEKPGFVNHKIFQDNLKYLKKIKYVQFGFMYRFKPTFLYFKNFLMNKNNLGNLKKVDSYAFVNQPLVGNKNWRSNFQMSGGGTVITQAIHLLDLLIQNFGDIKVKNKKFKYSSNKFIDLEANINLYNKDKKKFNLKASTIKKKFRKFEIKIKAIFDKAIFEVTDDKVLIKFKNKKIIKYYYNLYKQTFFEIGDKSFSDQYEYFINKRGNSNKNISDYGKVIMLVDKIYEI